MANIIGINAKTHYLGIRVLESNNGITTIECPKNVSVMRNENGLSILECDNSMSDVKDEMIEFNGTPLNIEKNSKLETVDVYLWPEDKVNLVLETKLGPIALHSVNARSIRIKSKKDIELCNVIAEYLRVYTKDGSINLREVDIIRNAILNTTYGHITASILHPQFDYEAHGQRVSIGSCPIQTEGGLVKQKRITARAKNGNVNLTFLGK